MLYKDLTFLTFLSKTISHVTHMVDIRDMHN